MSVKVIAVPPFEPPPPTVISYHWWSWHPRYPRWSKSCWGGATIEEAHAALERPGASKMQYYHNKLIMFDGKVYVEVEDKPCERLDVWEKCMEVDTDNDDNEYWMERLPGTRG